MWVVALGLAKFADCRREITHLMQDVREIVAGVNVSRIESKSLPVFRYGTALVAVVVQRNSQGVMHLRVVGLESQRLLIFGQGRVKFSRLIEGNSSIQVSLGIFWSPGKRSFGFAESLLAVSNVIQDVAEFGVCFGKTRVLAKDFGVDSGGLSPALLSAEHLAHDEADLEFFEIALQGGG